MFVHAHTCVVHVCILCRCRCMCLPPKLISECANNSLVSIANLLIFYSIGDNLRLLVDRPDGNFCFRLHKERVYYVRYVPCIHSVYSTRLVHVHVYQPV